MIPFKVLYYYKIILLFLLVSGINFYCKGNNPLNLLLSPEYYSIKDTIVTVRNIRISKPTDSIAKQKQYKTKLLSKEGIVIKQYAQINVNKKLNIKDTSTNQFNKPIPFVKSIEKDNHNNEFSKSLVKNIYHNKNLTEEPPVNLFSQLTDKKSISKQEFFNTIKQLNQLKKEIYKKNAEQKKTNPVRWLILLIAAILIVVILAFFIKEIFTLFLIAFMLIALVLLIGFL